MSIQIISELNKRNFAAKANTSAQRRGILWNTKEEEEVENRRLWDDEIQLLYWRD